MTTLLKTVLLKTRNIIEDREHTADSIIEDGILILKTTLLTTPLVMTTLLKTTPYPDTMYYCVSSKKDRLIHGVQLRFTL